MYNPDDKIICEPVFSSIFLRVGACTTLKMHSREYYNIYVQCARRRRTTRAKYSRVCDNVRSLIWTHNISLSFSCSSCTTLRTILYYTRVPFSLFIYLCCFFSAFFTFFFKGLCPFAHTRYLASAGVFSSLPRCPFIAILHEKKSAF